MLLITAMKTDIYISNSDGYFCFNTRRLCDFKEPVVSICHKKLTSLYAKHVSIHASQNQNSQKHWRTSHLLLWQQILRRGVIRLLVSRESHLWCGDVHLVTSQDAVGILLSPQVVVLRGGLGGSAWLDPAHFYGMNQFPDLTQAQMHWWHG